jgi:hypothetical protein
MDGRARPRRIGLAMGDRRPLLCATALSAPCGLPAPWALWVLGVVASLAAAPVAAKSGKYVYPPVAASRPQALPTYTDRPLNGSSQLIMSFGGGTRGTVWVTTAPAGAGALTPEQLRAQEQALHPSPARPRSDPQALGAPQPARAVAEVAVARQPPAAAPRSSSRARSAGRRWKR